LISMGSPRVTSRPSAPRGGGGTGGGTTGGGTTSVSGYDRYIGTLGAIADAPTGSNFPNYLTLPAAEKYDWIRVVTTSTINGVNFLRGQEWVCSAKTAKDLPVNWELRKAVGLAQTETFTLAAHGFSPGTVLRRRDVDPLWARASLQTLSEWGNLLVIETTTDTFTVPTTKGIVPLPNHGLGSIGDFVYLKWDGFPWEAIDGVLTASSPAPGDRRTLICIVFDENSVDYNPDNGYEVVV
jgi:hypothetical protein